jgi:hypothetical protein
VSEKCSKGYDPTMARMVGNILAGASNYQSGLATGNKTLCGVMEDNAIASVNRIIKALKKEFEG